MKNPRCCKSVTIQWFSHLIAGTLGAVLLLGSAQAGTPNLPFAKTPDLGGKRMASCLTRNLYVGFALEAVMLETNAVMIPFRVAEAYGKLEFTAFPARAKALAAEIGEQHPWFVGLQEVSLFRVQSPGDTLLGNPTPAETVTYDYLAILLQELEARGLHYRVASVAVQADVEMPAAYSLEDLRQGKVTDVRWTDRDVLLVRSDLPPGYLRVLREQHGSFVTVIATEIGGAPVVIKRGWCAVDVQVRGRQLRIINTHLEDLSPLVRGAQALELLNGPAKTHLPVICLGDFNADATHPDSDAYPLFVSAGFHDAWKTARPWDPGYTWGQEELLLNPTSLASERLDWVLFRGSSLSVQGVALTGNDPDKRVQVPADPPYLVWPSDHFGVWAAFAVR